MIDDPQLRRLLAAVASTTAAHDDAAQRAEQAMHEYNHRARLIQSAREADETAKALQRAEHALCDYLLKVVNHASI